jgi:two-component system, LytTR family, response regulator
MRAHVVRRSASAARRSTASGPNLPTEQECPCSALADLRILIADHALLARRQLRRQLAELEAISDIVECASGPAALAAVERERPHVVFLDAELPGGASLDPPASIRTRGTPAVVLMSGDEGMLKTYAAQRRDYLRKPVAREALRAVLEGARRRINAAGRADDRGPKEAHHRHGIPGRLVVRSAGRVLAVPTEHVEWIEADDNYVQVHKAGQAHVVRETLSSLEARLDPDQFARIHRGAIVNVSAIEELRSVRGAWQVRLRAGTTLPVGRRYRPWLREILATWIIRRRPGC